MSEAQKTLPDLEASGATAGSPDESVSAVAPHPWRIVDHHSAHYGYLSIVDATGKMICEFFPHAPGSRRREATLALAMKILEWSKNHEQ